MSQPERSGFAEHAEDVKHFPLEDRAQAPVPQGPIFLPAFGTQEGVLAERRLLRKLDFRLMPAIVAIFILNNIDAHIVLLCSFSAHKHENSRELG